MHPLSRLPLERARGVRAVLTDIDDTLTEAGRLPARAYAAMERLHEAGLILLPVTGRPAGWCDLIARQWPVDGVVGENGAFWFRYDDSARRMTRRYIRTEADRTADRERLDLIAAEVRRMVPHAAIAADQGFRSADLAIDVAEDVGPLPSEEVAAIVGIFEAHGATAKVSSIHVNGWFGAYDKLSTVCLMLTDEFGIPDVDLLGRVLFIGDSPNDAPMFAHFPNAVGVANVRRFAARLPAAPAYVTTADSADGFCELAEFLLAARAGHPEVAGQAELR